MEEYADTPLVAVRILEVLNDEEAAVDSFRHQGSLQGASQSRRG
jgi:hypothetical protein